MNCRSKHVIEDSFIEFIKDLEKLEGVVVVPNGNFKCRHAFIGVDFGGDENIINFSNLVSHKAKVTNKDFDAKGFRALINDIMEEIEMEDLNLEDKSITDIKRIILDLKKENSELKNSNQTIKEKVKKLSELNTNLETSYSGLKKKFSSLDPTKLETYKVLLMRKRINEHPERSLSDLAVLDTPLY